MKNKPVGMALITALASAACPPGSAGEKSPQQRHEAAAQATAEPASAPATVLKIEAPRGPGSAGVEVVRHEVNKLDRGGEPSQKPSLDLIYEAEEAGTITREQALAYSVYAVFGDSRLPAKFQGADSYDSMTLAYLLAEWDTLSPETQANLAPYLLPPWAPGSWYELNAASRPLLRPVQGAQSQGSGDDGRGRGTAGGGQGAEAEGAAEGAGAGTR